MASSSDEAGTLSAQQLEKLAEAAQHLDQQTQLIVNALSTLSLMTYVAWITVGIIALVCVVGWRWVSDRFVKEVDRNKIERQQRADAKLQELAGLIQKNVDRNKASLDRIADLTQSMLQWAASVDTDLLQRRRQLQRVLARITRVGPMWPRDHVPYKKIKETSGRMRDWYFNSGGICLSTEAMANYRMVQEALTTFETANDAELLDK